MNHQEQQGVLLDSSSLSFIGEYQRLVKTTGIEVMTMQVRILA